MKTADSVKVTVSPRIGEAIYENATSFQDFGRNALVSRLEQWWDRNCDGEPIDVVGRREMKVNMSPKAAAAYDRLMEIVLSEIGM